MVSRRGGAVFCDWVHEETQGKKSRSIFFKKNTWFKNSSQMWSLVRHRTQVLVIAPKCEHMISVSVDKEEAMRREGQKCWSLKENFQRKAKKHYKINPSYFYVLSGAVADLNPFLGKSLLISVLSGTLAESGGEKCFGIFCYSQKLSPWKQFQRRENPPDCVAFSFKWSIWNVNMNLGSFFFILNSAGETLNSEKWACQYCFS